MAIADAVDFLLVTALPDEFSAVKELVDLRLHPQHKFSVGALPDGSVNVGVVEMGTQGSEEAGSFVQQALSDSKPQLGCVLLGIAAGFPEAGVALGDVLVPYRIVPCADGKEIDVPRPNGEGERTTVLHRGEPESVSLQLFEEVRPVARDRKALWARSIGARRPDDGDQVPTVHCERSQIVGSVSRVVATELADDRAWLLSEFPPDSHLRAIGLERESIGVLLACRREGVEFLMVKGVQDDGTGAKDRHGFKDAWRKYAAKAAAAFVLSCLPRIADNLVRRDTWVQRIHERQEELARSFRSRAPEPEFTYRISPHLTVNRDSRRSLETLLRPTDADPFQLIRGGGGAGKTEILRQLFIAWLRAGLCPVLVNLRQYAELRVDTSTEELDDLTRADPAEVIGRGSAPRCSIAQLTRLTRERRVVVLLDGLNEVAPEVKEAVVHTLQALHNREESNCYIVATDRLSPSPKLPAFKEWFLEPLREADTATLYDKKFGPESFQNLSGRLQEIVRVPFFLNLALSFRHSYGTHRLQTEIFANFFEDQLRLSAETVDALARSAMNSIDQHGVLDATRFRKLVADEAVYERLQAAGVVGRNATPFAHDLWRDYLVSRELARREEWTYERLDRATTFAGSRECVLMAIEQLAEHEERDRFVKAVFDWHYVAAVDCLAALPPKDDGDPIGIPTCIAVLGAIAEKRFDRVARTRQRAEQLLSQHQYREAEPFRRADSRRKLAEHVEYQIFVEGWYQSWQLLFTKKDNARFSDKEFELISSSDALLGWAAANAARRCNLSRGQLQRLCSLYEASASAGDGYVRWRVIHILGAFASKKHASLLLRALDNYCFDWVQYGAARSLLENARVANNKLRTWIIKSLVHFCQGGAAKNRRMRSKIIFEILACTIIDDPPSAWGHETEPLWQSLGLWLDEEALRQLNALREFGRG